MPCDLAENQQFVKWQYANNGNAPCAFQFGMENDGTLSREFWCESSAVQTAPEWAWLDGGVKLVVSSLGEPPETMRHQFGSQLPFSSAATMVGAGSNNPPVEWLGFSDQMVFELLLQNWPTPDPFDLVVFSSRFSASLWRPNFAFNFGLMTQRVPASPVVPGPVGFFECWPLKCGNNC